MRIAVYPGSFDPITMGHIDIIKRIYPLFDRVVILVTENPEKKHMFSGQEREQLVRSSLRDFDRIEVVIHEGLTVDYLRSINASVIVRGMRAVVDFEYEMTMANMNKKLAPEIETLMVFASPEYYAVSSRGVKEIYRYGGDISSFVPSAVLQWFKIKAAGKGERV